VTFLADDLLEGRNTATRGYDIAAHWVASRFEALGLKPAGTEGWYQRVPLAMAKVVSGSPSTLTINDRRIETGTDVLISPNPLFTNLDETAEAVFVGYGLEHPDYKLDDYKNLDVRGKVVVALYGAPADVPSEIAATLNDKKADIAEAKGAIGILTIATPLILKSFPWDRIVESSSEPRLRWIEANGRPHVANPTLRLSGFLSPTGAAHLFKNASASWDQLAKQIEDKSARPKGFAVPATLRFERKSTVDRTSSPNVLGLLPGSDPTLSSEVIMLSAHLDHDGIVPPKDGDTIMNGAMDNAAGIATMLEAARAFVESGTKPKRSILFVALTAEEDGLLGSEYLAEYPLPAGRRLVGNVNLDMPILTYDFQDVTAFGAEHSTIGPIVERAVARIGVKLAPDPVPEQSIFTRTDHYSFVKKGVPAVSLATGYGGPGKKAAEDFLANHYHRVSDEVTLPFNWNAAAKFARVNYLIASELANAPEPPRWYAGNFFGDRFAKDQPKASKK
jgi:Zn-dependent M28 family amino/carboxypeptidase